MRSFPLNATEPIFSAEFIDIDETSQGRQSARGVEVLHRGEGCPVVSRAGGIAGIREILRVKISRVARADRIVILVSAGSMVPVVGRGSLGRGSTALDAKRRRRRRLRATKRHGKVKNKKKRHCKQTSLAFDRAIHAPSDLG